MSNLLPYNLNNSKLKDDNFESTINHNPHLENYNNKSDIYENYTNNNEKDVLIEKFSNHNSSCPLMSGDEVIIEHGANEDEHLIDIDNKKFAKKRKYLTKFKINEGEKDKIIKYDDSISLTKSGKKKHKIHPYFVKYKQGTQIDIRNNIVTAKKSPNLRLTYEFTVVTRIWQRERSNDWVRLIGKGNSKKRNYGLWVHPDGRSLSQIYGINSGHNVWPNTPVIPLKKWTHLATTFKKNGEHKFYFNGNLFKSLSTTGVPSTDNEPLTLGGANFHTTFNGLIKDSYVFNKVLNDEEIKKLSNHGSSCENLYEDAIGYWDFTKSLNDISRKTGNMKIRKNAELISGIGLKIKPGGLCSTDVGSPTVSIGQTKTLIALVTLDNLNYRSGTPFGIQIDKNNRHFFDSIVWGERENRKWMHGSEGFRRTRGGTSPVPTLNITGKKQMIVSKQYWDGNKWVLAFFIDGKQVDKYSVNPITYPKETFQAIIGPRVTVNGNLAGSISGIVEKCALFNKVFSDEEIESLNGDCVFKNFKIPTDSNHQKGDMVFYNDKVHLNKLGKILFTRPLGVPCSMKVPKTITGIDLNYKIKQIKVRCDDFFEMYIDGVTYKGSGWNKTFTFNNPIIKNPKGYIIGFKCTNGGGPGALIAQFEFENGSFMVTDNSWLGCNYIHNENLFKTNPTNYYHEKDSWKGVNVIGLNQNNKLKWDGRKIPSWDRWFVDSNFSQFANYIWAGKCLDAGSIYIKKSIGTMPWGESCSNNMTTPQAMCYLERYPSLKQQAIKALSSNYRYEFNSSRMSWNAHQNEARRRGGNLVCIHNKKVSDYIIRNFLHRCPSFGHWIGAYRINNRSYDRSSRAWRWIDGSSWTYENFLRKHYEPNNWREDKAHIWKHAVYGSWNDIPGSAKLPGVYQIKINENVDMNKIIEWAKRHWKNIGCKTNLTYSCLKPPATIGMYDYEGCYYEDYKKENIPNFRGKVTSLNQCQEKATANRDIVFGVTNFGDCYTGNDIKKVRRQSFSENCPSLGKDGSIQVYNRRRPFDPLDPELSKNNFSEKFTNKKNELEDPKLSKDNFSEKFQNNQKILTIVFILIIICLILYLCLTK